MASPGLPLGSFDRCWPVSTAALSPIACIRRGSQTERGGRWAKSDIH